MIRKNDDYWQVEYQGVKDRLTAAVSLITSIAIDPESNVHTCRSACAHWLDSYGYAGPLRTKRMTELKLSSIQKQIQELQEEYARLTGDGSPCG